jgi:hypothetical protein
METHINKHRDKGATENIGHCVERVVERRGKQAVQEYSIDYDAPGTDPSI